MEHLHSPTASGAPRPDWRHAGWTRAALGGSAGWTLAAGAVALGLDAIAPFHWARHPWLVAAACGALAWRCRRRLLIAFWAAAALPWMGLFLVIATPVTGLLSRSLAREDPLRPAGAILVLTSDIRTDGTPDRGMQQRLDHAYGLVEDGYARRLVIPRLGMRESSYLPAVRKQLARRGLTCQVEELGRVQYTHDEILELEKYLQRTDRRKVILVTEALHMRRVSALCRKRRIAPLRSPSGYAEFDYRNPTGRAQRLAAFRVWHQETFYHELNRLLGWL
jgi:uncharacterized SAM-binding protein YcdF (DUF218 family)